MGLVDGLVDSGFRYNFTHPVQIMTQSTRAAQRLSRVQIGMRLARWLAGCWSIVLLETAVGATAGKLFEKPTDTHPSFGFSRTAPPTESWLPAALLSDAVSENNDFENMAREGALTSRNLKAHGRGGGEPAISAFIFTY